MLIEMYQVDSFASHAFEGNPAGVCISEFPLEENLMLSIAAEMAVSETAFINLSDKRLRWFTPEAEVTLCGHGTLAVAHILRNKGLLSQGQSISFETLAGELTATILHDCIELDFPRYELSDNSQIDKSLLTALGLKSRQVVSSCYFEDRLIIEVDNEESLFELSPNFNALIKVKGRGIAVTTKSNANDVDFVSRYFAPWVGINEDPVTGSAQCALAEYWKGKLNKESFYVYQASRRGGYLGLRLNGDRVKIQGTAYTTISGTLNLSKLKRVEKN